MCVCVCAICFDFYARAPSFSRVQWSLPVEHTEGPPPLRLFRSEHFREQWKMLLSGVVGEMAPGPGARVRFGVVRMVAVAANRGTSQTFPRAFVPRNCRAKSRISGDRQVGALRGGHFVYSPGQKQIPLFRRFLVFN